MTPQGHAGGVLISQTAMPAINAGRSPFADDEPSTSTREGEDGAFQSQYRDLWPATRPAAGGNLMTHNQFQNVAPSAISSYQPLVFNTGYAPMPLNMGSMVEHLPAYNRAPVSPNSDQATTHRHSDCPEAWCCPLLHP